MEINQVTESNPEAQLQEWENNHTVITGAIARFVEDYARMPTNTELAADTRLSRQTITAHMEVMAAHPSYRQEIECVRILSAKVLGKVANMALLGDLDAAKLFSRLMAKHYPKAANGELVKNAYLSMKVNSADLNQPILENLSAEHRDTIEAIIKAPAIQNGNEDADWLARNEVWERNHTVLVREIDYFIKENSRVPGITELATVTGLSRPTITKHLKEFTGHPLFSEEIERFRSLSKNILAVVATQADAGNKKAVRLFFDIVHNLYPQTFKPESKKYSYLYANLTPIDQEKIDRLSPEQRSAIYDIISVRKNWDKFAR